MRATSKFNRVTVPSGGKPQRRVAGARVEPRHWKVEKVLVPVDFSAASRTAFQFALDLAQQHNARVHLLHVVEGLQSPEFRSLPLGLSSDKLLAKAKKDLVAFAQSAGSRPVVPVYPHVREGSAWEQIVSAAHDGNIDLIVLPTHGFTGVKRLMIGSVAERVVRHAPCPVLTLRNKGISPLSVERGKSGGANAPEEFI